MALLFFSRKPARPKASPLRPQRRAPEFEPAPPVALPEDPLERALQQGRLGLIALQPERWKEHPRYERVRQAALRAIDERFGLVPEGFVSIPRTIFDQPGSPETDLETEAYLLARCCVTQAEFQHFVDDGGYQDLELWPQDIWPHLIDFKDLTGAAGPRYWRNGRHDRREANHPVVGVCYYEALAYARWAGYRLPGDPEWQMAASWRIRSAAQVHRRYPWGDAFALEHCNIWASGIGRTVPVDAYACGAAPNGVLQLIGNVWEWTDSDFECTDDRGRQIVGEMLLKCIRGGSFDTYFPWQATAVFRSGLACLARAMNVGVRCALDAQSP